MEDFLIRGTGGIQTYLQTIFGNYDPIDTTSIAGADWQYIAGVVIFCIILNGILRILGTLFKK